MKRCHPLWLLFLLTVAIVLPSRTLWAAFDDYGFSASAGTFSQLSGGTMVIAGTSSGTVGAFDDQKTAGPYNIGFNFLFDGTSYSTFSLNTSGLIVLGGGTTGSYANSLTGAPVYPIIAGFWQHMHMYDGVSYGCNPIPVGISYQLTGSAPSRILIVEWKTQLWTSYNGGSYWFANCNSNPMMNFQVWLYEGTNKIEFHYGAMWAGTNQQSSASIGLASSSSRFISVTPALSPTISRSVANDAVNLFTNALPLGVIYTFSPCSPSVTGITGAGHGGTASMNNGDALFNGFSAMLGSTATYTPATLALVSTASCASNSYRLSISGSSDYFFGTPGTQTVNGSIAAGGSYTPAISFRPSTPARNEPATLTYTDLTNNVTRSYLLNASGATRINWIGNVSSGGTSTVASGDTLFKNISVMRHLTQSFTPLTLQNISTDLAATPAQATFAITNDPLGQYTLNQTSASIPSNGSFTPVITFSPTGVSYQEAKLTVTVDGETRQYLLRAISATPAGEFRIGSQVINSSTALFVNQTSCVGTSTFNQQVTVANIGNGNFNITGIDFYGVDTNYAQGTNHPLLRTADGKPVKFNDYVITLQPAVMPLTRDQIATLPIVIPQGGAQTIYITYIGARPGKRFAQAFIRTNGQNLNNIDTNMNGPTIPATITEGLLTFNLFAHADGAMLSDNVKGGLPKTVSFPNTAIGDSVDVTFPLVNAGICDLHLNQKALAINSGDVNEFFLVGGFTGLQPDGNGDYVLAPGAGTTVTVRFKPVQIGSRRASLMLRTNDSTIFNNGVTERGTYYLDMYSQGKFNFTAKPYVFGTAAIAADTLHGVVEVTNSLPMVLTVTSVAITGVDQGEFAQDPTTPWPSSIMLNPGQTLKLGVKFQPAASGVPGPRQAMLEVALVDGSTLKTPLSGVAGIRALVVSPTALNFPPIAVGKQARQVITLTNTGTMPVTLPTAPALSGTNATDFTLSAFPRLVLAPNQVEYLEVTYLPRAAGSSTATVTIASNAAGGAQMVALAAQASKTRLVLDPVGVIPVSYVGTTDQHPIARAITVRNEGPEAVRVTEMAFIGKDAGQFRVVSGPSEIAGNSESVVMVEVMPVGHDLSANLSLAAVNEVTGEELTRTTSVEATIQQTSGVTGGSATAAGMRLDQSIPNPARGEAVIGYRLSNGGDIRLSLYDVNGAEVRQLESGYREAGDHTVRVDVSDLSSGQYVYRLTVGGVSLTRSLTVTK